MAKNYSSSRGWALGILTRFDFRALLLACSLVCQPALAQPPGRAALQSPTAPPDAVARSPEPVARARLAISGEFGLGTLASTGQGAGTIFTRLGLSLGGNRFRPSLDATLVGWRSPLVREPGADWLFGLCTGLGAEIHFAHGRARSKLSVGPAFLLSGGSSVGATTALGVFIDVRPVGVLFPLASEVRLGVDPLGVRLLMPDVSAAPIYDTQFLTTVWLEIGR